MMFYQFSDADHSPKDQSAQCLGTVTEVKLDCSHEVYVGTGAYYRVELDQGTHIRVGPYRWRDSGREPRQGKVAWAITY